MSRVSPRQTADFLVALADALERNTDAIVAANAADLSKLDPSDYR